MSLTQDRIQHFKSLLTQRQYDLSDVSGAAEDAAAVVELDQTRVGRLSRMDALQAQEMSLETNRRRKIELQRIDTALRRLEAGDYGICVRCDEDIDCKRLEVDPATPVCITCAAARQG